MWFLNPVFWSLFFVLLVFYYAVAPRWQNQVLILANLLFLVSMGMVSAAVCLVSAIVNYSASRGLSAPTLASNKTVRRQILIATLLFQVGLLVVFKLHVLSGGALPLGLSFYSLMMMGYLLEVYWRRTVAATHFSEFFLSAAFFPLVAMGPIERFGRVNRQFQIPRTISRQNLTIGLYLICLGLFKKMAIADALLKFVIHDHPDTAAIKGWGLIAYSFLSFMQIYADFSGYIDIARGVARWLGIELIDNFNQPYLACGFSDVWQRWHISLTSWLKDFVYMPLLLQTRNISLAGVSVLLLTGIWHDISLNYVLWSVYWILLFEAYVLFRKWRSRMTFPIMDFEYRLGQGLTLLCISLSTLCFIAPSLESIGPIFARLLDLRFASARTLLLKSTVPATGLLYASISILAMMAIETVARRCPWRRYPILICALVFLIAAFAVSDLQAFIYLRF